MKTLLVGALLAAAIGAAAAEDRYDRRLERAVADIVAAKLGDLRGGLADPGASSIGIEPRDDFTTAAVGLGFGPVDGGGWKDGIAPATERRISEKVYR